MTNFDQELQQKLDALPRNKAPNRDLWRGIELGMEQPADEAVKPASRGGLYAIAASIALVACLSWFGFNRMPVTPSGQLTGTKLVQALSQQHEQQKQSLLVQYTDTPALTENWQAQLTELDQAANAIKAALNEDPDNTALLRMLQNVYQQQIALIERVHAPKWQQI